MIIAPGVRIQDWEKLDLVNKGFHQEWEKAIQILEKRIKERYLEPARLLVESENEHLALNRRFGFSVMAILCLLAETLQCFIEGKNNSNGETKQVFCRFLLNNEPFKSKFREDASLAENFYKNIRCGILHQAEITGGAKLWSIGPTIKLEEGHITVNRTKFYSGMVRMFDGYLEQLRQADERGITLRANLEKKMKHIIQNAKV